MPKIQFKRGLKTNLPQLSDGEPGFTTDTGELFIGSPSGNVNFAKKDDVDNSIQNLQTDVNTKNDERINDISSVRDIANSVKDQFDRVVAEAGSNNPEVVQARGGEVNLNARLENFNAQLAQRAIQLNHYAKGDGTDEITQIRQAFSDAMTQGKPIFLGEAASKYTISESIVIDKPLTIYSNGAKSIFEQLSWGVPCLEIRSDDVTIVGHFKSEVNTQRTVLDTTTLANSKNNDTIKPEVQSDPSSACSAIYCYDKFNRLKIDTLEAKGFVITLYILGNSVTLTENINVGTIIVDTVDFGIVCGGYRHFNIGTIQAKNITPSQNRAEHAIYSIQFSTGQDIYSYGLDIGSILCNGIQTPTSHIASLKNINGYHIGLIFGENVGTFFNTFKSTGYVDSIQGVSNVGDNLGSAIAIQDAPTDCTINDINITSEAQWIDSSNRGWGVSIVGGANARINNVKIKMISSSPSNAIYVSSTGKVRIKNIEMEYSTPLATVYAIYIAGTAKDTIIKNPKLVNHNKLYYKYTGAIARLIVDPNNIDGTMVNDNIIATDGVENTTFTAFNKTPFQDPNNSDPQPVIRSFNVIKFVRTVGNTVTNFRFATNGQEFIVIAGNNNTTIQNNTNIVTRSGSDLTAGSWKLAKFVWYDGVSYQI